MGHKASPSVFSWRMDFLLMMWFGYVSNYQLQRIRVITPHFSFLVRFLVFVFFFSPYISLPPSIVLQSGIFHFSESDTGSSSTFSIPIYSLTLCRG